MVLSLLTFFTKVQGTEKMWDRIGSYLGNVKNFVWTKIVYLYTIDYLDSTIDPFIGTVGLKF